MRILGGLFGGKIDMEVSADKAEYLPGETVTARFALTARHDVDVEEARAELVCENEYTHRERSYSGRTQTTRDVTSKDRQVQAREQLFGARTIRADESIDQSVSLQIPNPAIPSGEGEITKVRWKVGLVLSREHRLDPDAETQIRVLSLRDAYAERGTTSPDVDDEGDCTLEFRLPRGRDVRTGENVAGTLVVTARESLEPHEVRVELVRKEEVPRGEGNHHEEVEAAVVVEEKPSLEAGIPREFAFDLALPAGVCPTLETDESTARWYVRGVVARRLRSDYNILEELNVYTGQAA